MTTDPQIYEIQELTPRQKELIKASIPILEQSGEVLTTKFYQHMLSTYPDVKPFFNESDQKSLRQPKILAFALLNYAKNIDDLAPLTNFVNQIVMKHVGLQVKAEHYPIVGKSLLETMKVLLGEEIANEEFLTAWATAYGNLAQILINAEFVKYQENEWDGFREFSVTKIVEESEDVKSIYFTPKEGKISIPKRGQYVCIRWKLPGDEVDKSREYSLSEFPTNNEYRISVRLIEDGKISTFVHNNLKVGSLLRVAPPAGQFVYHESNKDLALFVGGIGITPLVSILEHALRKGRKVIMFNSNKQVETRPFTNWLKNLQSEYGDKFKLKEYFSNEQESNLEPIDEAENRRINPQDFEFINNDFDIYLLGPRAYMRYIKDNLIKNGVEESEISLEFFGPQEF